MGIFSGRARRALVRTRHPVGPRARSHVSLSRAGSPGCVSTAPAQVHAGVRPGRAEAPSSRQTSLTSTLHPSSVSSFFPGLSVSLFPPLLPPSPGLQLPPSVALGIPACQAILLSQRQQRQRSRDAAGGRAACSPPPHRALISAPSPPDQQSILPCSIKISRYLFNAHLLLWSALAARICSLSVWGFRSHLAAFQPGPNGTDSPGPWVLRRLFSSVSAKQTYSGLDYMRPSAG